MPHSGAAIRLGCVAYLNSLPFRYPLKKNIFKSQATLTEAIPTELNCQLSTQKLDLALTSSVVFLDRNYKLLPRLCIAANHQILSVNLYSQLPLKELSGKRLGLTHHSATSVELLQVLCDHYWCISPQFVPLNRNEPLKNYPAILLIGDEALVNLSLPGFETVDLASEWYAFTGLPFVFAVFSAQSYLSSFELEMMSLKLQEVLQWSENHLELLTKEGASQSGLPEGLIQKYFSLCNYRLEEKEIESLKIFQEIRHVSKI